MVYVCDRINDRIQVFTKSGTYLYEFMIAPATLQNGSTWCIAFSRDPGVSVRHLAGVSLLLLLPITIDLVEDVRVGRMVLIAIAASGASSVDPAVALASACKKSRRLSPRVSIRTSRRRAHALST